MLNIKFVSWEGKALMQTMPGHWCHGVVIGSHCNSYFAFRSTSSLGSYLYAGGGHPILPFYKPPLHLHGVTSLTFLFSDSNSFNCKLNDQGLPWARSVIPALGLGVAFRRASDLHQSTPADRESVALLLPETTSSTPPR